MKNDKTEQTKRLILAALERHDVDELLEMLESVCDQQDKGKAKYMHNDFQRAMGEHLQMRGFTVLKANTIQQQCEIEEMVEKIYPLYNERRNLLFAV